MEAGASIPAGAVSNLAGTPSNTTATACMCCSNVMKDIENNFYWIVGTPVLKGCLNLKVKGGGW